MLHKTILLLVVGAILLHLSGDESEAAIYKWKDESGKIHFTYEPNDSLDTFLSITNSFKESLAESISYLFNSYRPQSINGEHPEQQSISHCLVGKLTTRVSFYIVQLNLFLSMVQFLKF